MVSCLENAFDTLWDELFPHLDLETEFLLIPGRKFRADYAHIPSKTAVEINGGIWVKSKHSSGFGITRDYMKLNLAQSFGWCVFQLSAEMIDPYWLDIIAQTIENRLKTN